MIPQHFSQHVESQAFISVSSVNIVFGDNSYHKNCDGVQSGCEIPRLDIRLTYVKKWPHSLRDYPCGYIIGDGGLSRQQDHASLATTYHVLRFIWRCPSFPGVDAHIQIQGCPMLSG